MKTTEVNMYRCTKWLRSKSDKNWLIGKMSEFKGIGINCEVRKNENHDWYALFREGEDVFSRTEIEKGTYRKEWLNDRT